MHLGDGKLKKSCKNLACKFQIRTRSGPQIIIEARPDPDHGLRAEPGPRAEARPVQDPN